MSGTSEKTWSSVGKVLFSATLSCAAKEVCGSRAKAWPSFEKGLLDEARLLETRVNLWTWRMSRCATRGVRPVRTEGRRVKEESGAGAPAVTFGGGRNFAFRGRRWMWCVAKRLLVCD